jgi:hypothetical protein
MPDRDGQATINAAQRRHHHLVNDCVMVAVHDIAGTDHPSLRSRLVDSGVGDIDDTVETNAAGTLTADAGLPATAGKDSNAQRHY